MTSGAVDSISAELAFGLRYPRTTPPAYENLQKNFKKVLHLWKISVISLMRTNFAEMPGKSD